MSQKKRKLDIDKICIMPFAFSANKFIMMNICKSFNLETARKDEEVSKKDENNYA